MIESFANLLVILITTASLPCQVLPLVASGASSAEGAGQSKVDVLLAVNAHHEGGNVNDLLADADVLLADQDTCMMDRLGQALLEDNSLQAALQEIIGLQSQHVIELVLGLVQQTILVHAAHQSLS